MKIQEYQARQILERYGIPIPRGEVATTPDEAEAIAEHLAVPVVVKAQVLVGGRGKAGGVKLAQSPSEAGLVASKVLGMNIKGTTVRKVLVAEATDITKELYLGVVINRTSKVVTVMASGEGGIDIEEVARVAPQKIVKVDVDPLLGLRDYQSRELSFGIGLEGRLACDFARIALDLQRAFVECDASLAEINPLAIDGQGTLKAIDAKIILDENALFRHKELESLRDSSEEDPHEWSAREQGLSYVKLEGNIGCMVNGAGLAMATMDLIKLYGGAPANFLDIGGGARADQVAAALKILLSDRDVRAILLNIFGGITRCDEVAYGIVAALRESQCRLPVVARLVGTNEEEGQGILSQANLITAQTMEEAAKRVVHLLEM
ncbi:MAG: ADP-forming succinate--CoA ligase subunit beta [Chloroflexi bacterium]|nr:ADP-forming succinate--CoA ligase subunit beta [Chloroflexota bacterium]MCL5075011.1 ADP-forming succinate--CoA ligase subunit beta [Chloroflexota bacterium]